MQIKVLYLIISGTLLINLLKGFNLVNLESNFVVNIFILLFSIIIIFLILTENNNSKIINNLKYFIILTFVIRLLLMYWDVYFSSIVSLPGSGMDTLAFDRWAKEYVNNDLNGVNGYAAVLGIIYKIYYPNALWGQYLNVILSILTIYIVQEIFSKLEIKDKYKVFGILILCFIPNYLISSSILLRESIVIFLLALSIRNFLIWWQSGKNIYVLNSLISILCATYLHSGTIAYALALFLIIAFANNKDRNFKINISTFTLGGLAIVFFIVIYSFFGNIFLGYANGIESVEDFVDKSENAAYGNAAYSANLIESNSVLGLLVNSPIRALYFLMSPLPWDWRGLGDVIAFLTSSLFYFLALFYGFKALNIKKYRNKNLLIAILIFSLTSAFIYSWGVSNAGTAIRHRDKFLVVYLMILVISLDGLSKKNKNT
ncbi:hypothetical protein EVJ27_06935 [Exiguobacterium sp. SH3S2]|uniref:hypothetical protein n=1 Tax=unclassified Exiguobacterium TaxID=2644629 RepID=UPI00103D3790|nr:MULTISPECIES: hypothetical protein [unclassified Exiguobacterium]TCI46218.1 hypothetical protein EVJ28_06930 [Exiguobacterium sp. SH3S3]TCI61306.1 hypothetical protein EVJ27_06935 [Exiguobacterium sp. SH3S2]